MALLSISSHKIKSALGYLLLALTIVPVLFSVSFSPRPVINTAYAQQEENKECDTKCQAKKAGDQINNAYFAGMGGGGGNTDLSCNIFGSGSFDQCLLIGVRFFVYSIPAYIFWIAGALFDTLIAFSLNTEVIKMPDFVDIGWVIIRDICNTFFIFILLYIAISTILQTSGGQTKRLLASLIMVALVMNFSLYATRFVIDVGNIFALEFYKNIGNEKGYVTLPGGGVQPRDISSQFSSIFNPQSIIGNDFIKNADEHTAATAFMYLMAGITVLVASFVFLTVAFLFLARVVTLWLVMIFSPLAFFSFILPQLRAKVWGRWSSELISATFMPVIFLFFVYLILKLAPALGPIFTAGPDINSIKVLEEEGVSFAATLLVVFLKFFVVIALLLAALKTAKGASGQIGETFSKYGAAAVGTAVLGGGALALRNSAGRIGQGLSNKYGKDWEKSKIGRGALAVTNTMAGASYDARGSKLAGALSQATGTNLGKAGGTGGYAASLDTQTTKNRKGGDKYKDKPEAHAEYIRSLEKTNIKGMGRIDKDEHAMRYWKNLGIRQREEAMLATKDPETKAYLTSLNEKLTEGFSDKQKKEGAKEAAPFHIETMEAMKTSADKVAHIKTLSDDQKLAVYKNMTHRQRDEVETTDPTAFAGIKGSLSKEEQERITESAQKSKEIESKRAKEKILDTNKKNLNATTDPLAAERILNDMEPEEIAKVDPNILVRPHVVLGLDGAAIEKIGEKGKLTVGQRSALVREVVASRGAMQTTALQAMLSLAFTNSITPGERALINAELKARP